MVRDQEVGGSNPLAPTNLHQFPRNQGFACAVKRRWSTAGESPARELFAPPGSNRSSSGGNEAAEASGVEGRIGDLASL
jgi:hypothetical protein